MRFIKTLYFLIIIVEFSTGCREPFQPEIDKYENILVIDGLITDQVGPHMVRLTRSYAYDETRPLPEEGALVMILNERQTLYTFTEAGPGIYYSSPFLEGEVGVSYKLLVETTEGESYESEWVLLSPVPEIDSVTLRFEERPTTNPDQSLYGIQVYVTTHDPSNHTRYYRWEWLETWEFITPVKSSSYPDEERCWKTTGSSVISIGTTEHLSSDILEEWPLYFISSETSKLRIRYSALISQYSLSREAYSYWKSLQDITQNTGSLFDPTPAMVTGNISNMADPDKPVLGIFQASAVSQNRIFIERNELPSFLDIPSGYASCQFFETADSLEIANYFRKNTPFVDKYTYGGMEFYLFSNSEACFRCTLSGTNERPEFWPWED